MDRSVKPGDDFFGYVNGGWAKRTEIAADRTFVGIDSVLNDQIDKDVRAIVEDMARNPAAIGQDRPAGRRFLRQLDGRSGDRGARAPRRSSPISPRSRRSSDQGDLTDLFATAGFPSPIGIGDLSRPVKSPTRYAIYAGQSGLGMPSRDYYLLHGRQI